MRALSAVGPMLTIVVVASLGPPLRVTQRSHACTSESFRPVPGGLVVGLTEDRVGCVLLTDEPAGVGMRIQVSGCVHVIAAAQFGRAEVGRNGADFAGPHIR